MLSEITTLPCAGLAASVGEAVLGAVRTPPYVHPAESDAGVVAVQPGVSVASGDPDSKGAAALMLWHQRGMLLVAKDASPSASWNGSMAAYPLHATLEDAAAELFPCSCMYN